jgi:hypothetical protein
MLSSVVTIVQHAEQLAVVLLFRVLLFGEVAFTAEKSRFLLAEGSAYGIEQGGFQFLGTF